MDVFPIPVELAGEVGDGLALLLQRARQYGAPLRHERALHELRRACAQVSSESVPNVRLRSPDLSRCPSVKQIASRLDLSQSYVRRLIRDGVLEGERIDAKSWRVFPESIDVYEAKRSAP